MTIGQRLCNSRSQTLPRLGSQRLPLTLAFLLMLFVALTGQAQTFTILHRFTAKGDGQYPGSLLRDKRGDLYGVTYSGGAFDYGTIFAVNVYRKETVLHSFWSGDGAGPAAAQVQDHLGNFYGTTYEGGTVKGGKCIHGCGTVFKMDRAGNIVILHRFSGGADGGNPASSLILDEHGNLYGTTSAGGDTNCSTGYSPGCGLVFRLTGDGKETVLHTFGKAGDGAQPGSLIRDKTGRFYGVTASGGSYYWGTVFKLEPDGKETVLYSFRNSTDGGNPEGSLVEDGEGNLYGTADSGGDSHCKCGVVFKLDSTGKETVLYTFKGGADGSQPWGTLVRDTAGNLYGTTLAGGVGSACFGSGCGTVFKIDAKGNETVLYRFTGKTDGSFPASGLIMDESGNLYGSAQYGGDSSCGEPIYGGCGVVFKFTP